MNFKTKQAVGLALGSSMLLPLGCATQYDTSVSHADKNTSTSFAQQRCADMQSLTIAGYDLEIASSQYVSTWPDMSDQNLVRTENFSPYCKVTGYFEHRTGANDKPYAIGIGLSLPDDWNGRFLFQGGGALNGLIRDPLGALAAGDTPALYRGFVVVSTDSGHQSDSLFNHDFFEDQKALLNFYSQAVYKTSLLAQKVVSNYYSQPASHSYFVGCSTGGREAMIMSQRYPELFDGIIAGAPAMRTNLSEIADLWAATSFTRIAEQGYPFSDAQKSLVVNRLLEQCDTLDGLEDGLVMNTAGCDFEPTGLQCKTDQNGDACLAEPQIQALKQAMDGPKYPDGSAVYPGFYYDVGIAAKASDGIPGLLQGVAGPLGKSRADMPFDLDRELTIANNFPLAPGNATLKNLSTFSHTGGKLMFFHGVSDPWFSAKDTVNYFNEMNTINGGSEKVKSWSQLYLVPGMGHCHGGEKALDQFDMLTALVEWVEQDKPPQSVVATGKNLTGISRPLCPYPKVSHYVGQGDSREARSFECRE